VGFVRNASALPTLSHTTIQPSDIGIRGPRYNGPMPGGRHFLQVPGPTNVPFQVTSALATPTIDHRGPQFRELATDVLQRVKAVFGTTQPVVIYPSSGTGAWEAALVNTLCPGDRVLAFETGHFATLWSELASSLGLRVDLIPGDWRHGVDPSLIAQRLTEDRNGDIAAVCVVHNETSTGVLSRMADIRSVLDEVDHPALLMVDTISSLGSAPYFHDGWNVDVTIGGSQKGLMLPPGLAFNAVSTRALERARSARLQRGYWDWTPMLDANSRGLFPYTPATNMLFGLQAALTMLESEGHANVYARHERLASATRAAVQRWGLELVCSDDREYSPSLTAVMLPEGADADALRATILDRFDLSLGAGLGRLAGRVFRIGHLGHIGELELLGTLAGVQAGLQHCGLEVDPQGIVAAVEVLSR